MPYYLPQDWNRMITVSQAEANTKPFASAFENQPESEAWRRYQEASTGFPGKVAPWVTGLTPREISTFSTDPKAQLKFAGQVAATLLPIDPLSVALKSVSPLAKLALNKQVLGQTLTFAEKGAIQTLRGLNKAFASMPEGELLRVLETTGGKSATVGGAKAVSGAIPETLVTPKAKPSEIPEVTKLRELIKAAKPAVRETKQVRGIELKQRVASASTILEQGEGREAFKASTTALKGKLPEVPIIPPEQSMSPVEITNLFNMVKNSDKQYFTKLNTSEALNKILLGDRPQEGELKLLQEMFGKEFTDAIASKSMSEKVWQQTIDALNIPRVVLSAYDVSMPLRQGWGLVFGHPLDALKSTGSMFKALARETYAQQIQADILARPLSDLADQYKLRLPGLDTVISQREEFAISKLAQKIPGIRASNRAAVVFLNDLRSRVWEQTASRFIADGLGEKELGSLAKLINIGTGWGYTPKMLNQAMPALNAVLFSPRLLLSRLEYPAMLVNPRIPKAVRLEAARNLVSGIGTVTAILGLLKVSGVGEVGIDPRSADFGKLRVGKTRLDLWGGFIQYARLAAQLSTGKTVTSEGKVKEQTQGATMGRFVQSKLSPIAGLLFDLLNQRTYAGEELKADWGTVGQQAYSRFTPLFLQDMIDAIGSEGLAGGATAMPAAFGAGVVTYKEKQTKAKRKGRAGRQR